MITVVKLHTQTQDLCIIRIFWPNGNPLNKIKRQNSFHLDVLNLSVRQGGKRKIFEKIDLNKNFNISLVLVSV